MPTAPIPDPTTDQLHAAARDWFDDPNPVLTDEDLRLVRVLLTAPTVYAALCQLNGIDPDDQRRWEFAGESYRLVDDARAAAHAVTETAERTCGGGAG